MKSAKCFTVPAIAVAALSLAALGGTPALAAAQPGASQTMTAAHANPQSVKPADVVVEPGTVLDAGDFVDSGTVTLIMQDDGNLVLYQDGGVGNPNQALWSSKTSGDNYAIMQDDGNFVIYPAAGGAAVWASNTSGNNVLDVQQDGNVVIYPADHIGDANYAEWSTGTGR
jgi:hypothetical protein